MLHTTFPNRSCRLLYSSRNKLTYLSDGLLDFSLPFHEMQDFPSRYSAQKNPLPALLLKPFTTRSIPLNVTDSFYRWLSRGGSVVDRTKNIDLWTNILLPKTFTRLISNNTSAYAGTSKVICKILGCFNTVE